MKNKAFKTIEEIENIHKSIKNDLKIIRKNVLSIQAIALFMKSSVDRDIIINNVNNILYKLGE